MNASSSLPVAATPLAVIGESSSASPAVCTPGDAGASFDACCRRAGHPQSRGAIRDDSSPAKAPEDDRATLEGSDAQVTIVPMQSEALPVATVEVAIALSAPPAGNNEKPARLVSAVPPATPIVPDLAGNNETPASLVSASPVPQGERAWVAPVRSSASDPTPDASEVVRPAPDAADSNAPATAKTKTVPVLVAPRNEVATAVHEGGRESSKHPATTPVMRLRDSMTGQEDNRPGQTKENPDVLAARVAKSSAPTENSTARISRIAGAQNVETEKHFLTIDEKPLAGRSKGDGTGVALPADDMRPASQLQPRSAARGASRLAGGTAAGEAEQHFVTWKGWTNGGGERASTAAQFSRLADHAPVPHASYFAAPSFTGSRMTAAATAPVATAGSDRTFPSSETDLMAPIGAAIARLVSRGQDHLSITVRFEQGGTLSLKLAMRDGEIASRIQTDVPGLEGALRSAWGQFAHDWQGRGLKLANPSFDAGVADHQPGDKGTRNPASDRDGPYSESGRTASSSFTPSPVSVRGAPVRRPSGNPSTADSGVTPGLKTWA